MSPVVQDASSFKYKPLNLEERSIRLLRLLHLGSTLDIECELFQVSLHDDWFQYEALSYTWGGADLTEPITVDGKTFYVTKNLYTVLAHLRLESADRIVWIDAVCIDQENAKERGHQVQQMGDIYSRAEQVLFWLGTATFEIIVLMDCLEQLKERSLEHAYKDWKRADPRWKELWFASKYSLQHTYANLETDVMIGLQNIIERDWFKRVWILQEVANAKKASVCAGRKVIPARIFVLASVLIGYNPEPHCQAVLDIMPGASRLDSGGNLTEIFTRC
jgi:hypothetical protein